MNREQVMRNLKREMKRWIEQIDESNYINIKENMDKYYGVMEAVSALPEAPAIIRKTKKAPTEPEVVIESKENVDETTETLQEKQEEKVEVDRGKEKANRVTKYLDKEKQELYIQNATDYYQEPADIEENPAVAQVEEEEEKVKGYVFERKLRGGILPDIDAFVPEGIIRRLGVQHGDLVQAEKQSEYGNRIKYHYTLVESRNMGEAPGRIQVDYCLVEKEAGHLVVKGDYLKNQSIRFDGVRYSLILNEQDIRNFEIKEGDIIDVAYKAENPAENKVLWMHETKIPVQAEEKTETKRKEVDTRKEMSEELKQTLAGVNVLIIGNESSKANYQAEIEKRGGTFLWADSNKRMESYPSMVRKCSFAIFLLGLSGHTCMKQFKQLCKDQDKPFEATFDQGITSIIRTAEELATGRDVRQKETV